MDKEEGATIISLQQWKESKQVKEESVQQESKQDSLRVVFDFHGSALKRLDEMMVELGASSRAEVVRRALAACDKLLQEKKDGFRILLVNKRGEEFEIELFP